MAINIGPQIGIDGEPEFRRQINNIVQQCKTLDSEMKSLSSAFDENDSSQERLTQQSQILTRQIEAQTKRIELLQKGLDESAKKYGENDTKTLKWKQAVQDATTTLNRLNRQLEDVNSAMTSSAYDQLTREIEAQEAEVKRLRTAYQSAVLEFGDASDEANQLGRELSDASSQLKQSRTAMNQTADAADALDKSLDDAADSADDLDSGFSGLDSIIGGNVIADGISNIAGSIKDMYEESIEFRRIMGSLEVSSQNFGYTSEQTAESFNKLIGVLGDTQTAATTLSNLQALGLEQEDLNTLIDDAIGAWARYGDSIPIDSLAESVTETINTRQVTGTFADVLNWATGEEDSFNEALQGTSDKGEAAQLVLDKLNELDLTHLGEEWQKNNDDLMDYNQSQHDLQQAMADFSENFGPIINTITREFAGFLEQLSGFFDLLSENQAVMDAFTTSISTISDFLTTGTGLMSFVTDSQKNAAESAMEWAEANGYLAEEEANANIQTQALTEATAAQSEATEVATQKLGAQLQAFVDLDEGTQERVVNIVAAMTDMQTAISDAVNSQLNWFGAIQEDMAITSDTVLESMQTQMDAFNTWGQNLADLSNRTDVTINEGLLQYLANMGPEGAEYVAAFNSMTAEQLSQANELWEESIDIQNMTSDWGMELQQGVGEIAAGGEVAWNQLANDLNVASNTAGEYTAQGFINAMQKASSQAKTAGNEFGNTFIDALDVALGVSSPSWKTEQSGSYTAQGFINALYNATPDAMAAGQQLANAATSGVESLNYGEWHSIGYNVALGLASGISSGRSEVISAAADIASAAAAAAKKTLDINSPSGVFEEIGDFSSQGFLIGFKNNDIRKEIGDILDFQQQRVNAIISMQYRNAEDIFSVVYQAVRQGIQGVQGRDREYLDIIDRMSRRPIVTENYMDGKPIGFGVAKYVSAAQKREAKIKSWVNGVRE